LINLRDFLINVLVEEPGFSSHELSWSLEKVRQFFQNYGARLNFVWRRGIIQPLLGDNLYFSQPNGSHAQLGKAKVTLNNWTNEIPINRPRLIIHELGHAIFDLPDHYEGAQFYEPSSEPCVMYSLSEGTFCSKCREKIKDRISPNILSAIGVVFGVIALATSPLWGPPLLKAIFGKKGS